MRIYTPAGDLSFKTFTFPDGQPHFKLETIDDSGFTQVTIEIALRSPSDLFTLLLASATLRASGYTDLRLDCRYLLGARMDRAIDSRQPATLEVVARVINSCGFSKVRILDVHSEVATKLIRNSVNVLPHRVVEQVRVSTGFPFLVCPDKGAVERVRELSHGNEVIYCEKVREMSTGKLSGFKVNDYPTTYDGGALIIDDICDGGGTFVGLAKELRKAGANKVMLYITHNVQGKTSLDGIDKMFTTDSFMEPKLASGPWNLSDLCVIPISMKEL